MMQRTSIVYIISLIFMLSCDTASSVDELFRGYFVKYYGEDGNQDGVDLLVNPDGTMILLGNSSLQTNAEPIPFMVKIDPEGKVLWQRQLGERNERAVDVEPDNDGNLIVVSNLGDEESSKIRIFRIDQEGHGIDSATIGVLDKQVAMAVTILSDNSTLITGYTSPVPGRNLQLVTPPPDEADILIVRLDASWNPTPYFFAGEHVGRAVKAFEVNPKKYYIFGDSDRPLDKNNPVYKRSFEVMSTDDFFGNFASVLSGLQNEKQIVSSIVETPAWLQEGYLMVGTSYSPTSSDIYITQYNNGLGTKRLDFSLLLGKTLEGISVAIGEPDNIFILGNEILENTNKKNIFLVRLAGDGAVIGTSSFGTVEGDDSAGAVRVLEDGRVAVLGTMELETQKKIVLMIMNPDGKFSN